MRRVELSAAGVHPETLARLVQEGTLTRFTRGLYQLGDADITALLKERGAMRRVELSAAGVHPETLARPHELAEVAQNSRRKGSFALSPPCSSTNSRCKCRVESGLP